MKKKELAVAALENGTVIDHIPSSSLFKVVNLLQLEKLTGIPCREDLVIRTKHTGAQKDLGPAERLRNMENAFRLTSPPAGITRALLIDDIYTTGSTLDTLSRLLSDAGIPEIYTATLCISYGKPIP